MGALLPARRLFPPRRVSRRAGLAGRGPASLEASTAGDLQRAFDGIRNVPETVPDPRFFAYRASLLLAVGRVDEAGADIQRALSLRANDPNALALQTIIAVAQNEPDRALQVAQQAVQAAPESATARIALSYAQQARFDLEGARASLEEAVKREPENALAWARLAEMHASFGRPRPGSGRGAESGRPAAEPRADPDRPRLRLPDAGQDETGPRGLREGDRARPGRSAAAAGSRSGEDPGRLAQRGRPGRRDRREPGFQQRPGPELPGQGLLRGEARAARRARVLRRQAARSQRPDPLVLRRDREADHEPAGRGAAGPAEGDRAERQPGGLPLAPPARLRPRGPQRQPGPDLHGPRLPAARPGRGLEVGQHRPDQLLGPPLPGRLVRGPAAPRDRPRQRAPPVPAAAADQHHAHPAAPRGEQPVPDQRRRARGRSPSTSSTPSSTGTASPSSCPASSARTTRTAGEAVIAGIYDRSPSASATATSRPTGSG